MKRWLEIAGIYLLTIILMLIVNGLWPEKLWLIIVAFIPAIIYFIYSGIKDYKKYFGGKE